MAMVSAKSSQGLAGSAHTGDTGGAGGSYGAPVWFVKSNGPPVKDVVVPDGETAPLGGVDAHACVTWTCKTTATAAARMTLMECDAMVCPLYGLPTSVVGAGQGNHHGSIP